MLGGTLLGKLDDSVRHGHNDVLALGSHLTVYLKTYRFSNFPFQGTLRQATGKSGVLYNSNKRKHLVLDFSVSTLWGTDHWCPGRDLNPHA